MLKQLIKKILGITQVVTTTQNLSLFTESTFRRALYFKKLIDLIGNVEGAIIECGVGQGNGLAVLCSLVSLEKKNRPIWAFDSFEGFPQTTENDVLKTTALTQYKQFTLEYVFKTLVQFGLSRSDIDRMIRIAKGYIPDSLSQYDQKSVAFINVDLDIYQSYKDALEYFYPFVVPGGIIAFDEYNKILDIAKWPGALKAIDEFVEKNNLKSKLVKDEYTGNCYLIK